METKMFIPPIKLPGGIAEKCAQCEELAEAVSRLVGSLGAMTSDSDPDVEFGRAVLSKVNS